MDSKEERNFVYSSSFSFGTWWWEEKELHKRFYLITESWSMMLISQLSGCLSCRKAIRIKQSSSTSFAGFVVQGVNISYVTVFSWISSYPLTHLLIKKLIRLSIEIKRQLEFRMNKKISDVTLKLSELNSWIWHPIITQNANFKSK